MSPLAVVPPWEPVPPPTDDDAPVDLVSDCSAPRAARPAAGVAGGTGSWPEPLAGVAFRGVVGEFVNAVSPHVEADRAALLGQFLVAVGSVIGPEPHVLAGADVHGVAEFVVLVGPTASGRKGFGWTLVRKVLALVDPAWEADRIVSGLGSGEALVAALGADQDRRLLVHADEFGSLLRVARREGNILSPLLRSAWGGQALEARTKRETLRAPRAHVSLIGHVTLHELRAASPATATQDGLFNRILWIASRRGGLLPEGGNLDDARHLAPIAAELREIVARARTIRQLVRAQQARWAKAYAELAAERAGAFGGATARAEAHALRLSVLYTLLDRSSEIRPEHLEAALAVWRFAEDSAAYIFGRGSGNTCADEVLEILRDSPQGLTQTQLRDAFHRNLPRGGLAGTLEYLHQVGLAFPTSEQGSKGAPAKRWRAASIRPTTERHNDGIPGSQPHSVVGSFPRSQDPGGAQ